MTLTRILWELAVTPSVGIRAKISTRALKLSMPVLSVSFKQSLGLGRGDRSTGDALGARGGFRRLRKKSAVDCDKSR